MHLSLKLSHSTACPFIACRKSHLKSIMSNNISPRSIFWQGGNRFQYLDCDRWQRDNSDRYHDNYGQYQSRNFGSQNPRYQRTGESWSQNRNFGSRNPSMGSGSHQNWNEYSGRDHMSRNPFLSQHSGGRGQCGGQFGRNYDSSRGEGSHTQIAVDPVTPRDIT